MAVIFYLSSQTNPLPELTAAVWDKALHFVEFAGLAVLLGRAFLGEGSSPGRAFLAAVVVASLYAASDEVHQIWVEGRESALRDWNRVGAPSFSLTGVNRQDRHMSTRTRLVGVLSECASFVIPRRVRT